LLIEDLTFRSIIVNILHSR